MIIVKFQYAQKSPSGGIPYIDETIKFFDDNILAKELEYKIEEFLNDDKNGYRTNIIVKLVERI